MVKYINEKQFTDFKSNFTLLVETLNHNITKIEKNVDKAAKATESTSLTLAELKGSFRIQSKITWGLVGVVFTVIAGIIIGAIV